MSDPFDFSQITFTPTEEQAAMLKEIETFLADPAKKAISLTGAAGTGKTATLKFLIDKMPKKTVWAAMTGKAAQRLYEATGVYARTLHGTLYAPPKVDHNSLEFDELAEPAMQLLVVDECSMMTPRIYQDLLEWQAAGVKMIFVGDAFQLPPIMSGKEIKEWGNDFSVFNEVQGPTLKTVMRSVGDIVKVATQLRTTKIMPRQSIGDTYVYKTAIDPISAAVADYLADPDDHALITWTNATRMEANKLIRRHHGLQTVLAKNEPVLIRKNGQGYLNGDVLKVVNAQVGVKVGPVQTLILTFEGTAKPAVVSMQGGSEPMDGAPPNIPDRGEYWKYRNELKKQGLPEPLPVTYGYCFTTHLIQGSQARRVTIFLRRSELGSAPFMKPTRLPDGTTIPFGVRLLYTAATRAKEKLTIITD